MLVGKDEAPDAVRHYRFTLTRAGSNMLVVGNGKPSLDADSPQPYGVVSARSKDVVLENDIFSHFL